MAFAQDLRKNNYRSINLVPESPKRRLAWSGFAEASGEGGREGGGGGGGGWEGEEEEEAMPKPHVELRAGARTDPLSLEQHAFSLVEKGKLVTTRFNPIRVDPSRHDAMRGTGCILSPSHPNSIDALHNLPRSAPVSARPTTVNPAGSYHPNLSLWGAKLNGPPLTSSHFGHQTQGFSEEERRLFLLTGERRNRLRILAYTSEPQRPPLKGWERWVSGLWAVGGKMCAGE